MTKEEEEKVPYLDSEGNPIASRYGFLAWPEHAAVLADAEFDSYLRTLDEWLQHLEAERQPSDLLCCQCDNTNAALTMYPEIHVEADWQCSECRTDLTGRCWRSGRFTIKGRVDDRRCTARSTFRSGDLEGLHVPAVVQESIRKAHLIAEELAETYRTTEPVITHLDSRKRDFLAYDDRHKRLVVDPKLKTVVAADRYPIKADWVRLS